MALEIRLKEVREKKGLSQNKLANRLDMSLQNIQRIEYGKAKSIPIDTLDKLCQVLECGVEDILVYSDKAS